MPESTLHEKNANSMYVYVLFRNFLKEIFLQLAFSDLLNQKGKNREIEWNLFETYLMYWWNQGIIFHIRNGFVNQINFGIG